MRHIVQFMSIRKVLARVQVKHVFKNGHLVLRFAEFSLLGVAIYNLIIFIKNFIIYNYVME